MVAWSKFGSTSASPFRAVSKRAKKRTVFEARTEMRWISDIRGEHLEWLC
jgi:hypothetical protein